MWHVTVCMNQEERGTMGQHYTLDIMVKQIKPFELNQTANGVLKCGVWCCPRGIHRHTPGGHPCPDSSCPSCLEFDKLKLYKWQQRGTKELSWLIGDRRLHQPGLGWPHTLSSLVTSVSLAGPDLIPPHATLTKITAVSSFCASVSSQWLLFSFDSPGSRSLYGLHSPSLPNRCEPSSE